jgi:hypothetical protein
MKLAPRSHLNVREKQNSCPCSELSSVGCGDNIQNKKFHLKGDFDIEETYSFTASLTTEWTFMLSDLNCTMLQNFVIGH